MSGCSGFHPSNKFFFNFSTRVVARRGEAPKQAKLVRSRSASSLAGGKPQWRIHIVKRIAYYNVETVRKEANSWDN